MSEPAESRRYLFSASFVRIAICGLILVAVFAIYRQCQYDQFIEFDDRNYVFGNAIVSSGLSWHNVRWALTATEAANWHPLTWWAHMADVELFGLRAGGHVMTNVLLHGFAAAVLFLVLEKIVGNIEVAAFVALVFAVHPANVESVAWISQKKSTLSALFAFLAIGAYWYYGTRPTWRRYWLVFCLYLLSLFAKPMMVTFPLLAVLLDFWPLRRVQWPWRSRSHLSPTPPAQKTDRTSPLKNWLWLVEKIPFVALAIASSIVTSIVQYHAGAMGDIAHVHWSTRFANVLYSYVRYLGQLFWPHGHALLYPFPASYSPVLILSCVLGLAAITWLAIRNARGEPALFVGWVWFVLTMVPVIGLIQVGNQSMADRYLYLPMIGPVLGLAIAGRSLAVRWPSVRILVRFIGMSWIALLAFAAWIQASFWTNSETIMKQAIANTKDNFVMNGALATYYYSLGQWNEAENYYHAALIIKPRNPGILAQLGATLGSAGRYSEAIELLKESARLVPTDAGYHNNLGVLYARTGKIPEAKHEFSEAIRLNPDYTAARDNLAGAVNLLLTQSPTPPVPNHPPTERKKQ